MIALGLFNKAQVAFIKKPEPMTLAKPLPLRGKGGGNKSKTASTAIFNSHKSFLMTRTYYSICFFTLFLLSHAYEIEISPEGSPSSGKSQSPPRFRIQFHLYTPILSSSGYGTEGLSIIQGLKDYQDQQDHERKQRSISVCAYHHGDSINNEYVDHVFDLNQQPNSTYHATRSILSSVLEREKCEFSDKAAPTVHITICHSEPGAWNVLQGPKYRSGENCPRTRKRSNRYNFEYDIVLGRTMFETDRLPDGWELRLNSVDYVMVPSAFAKNTFTAGGVEPSKVIVWEEGVDTDWFDRDRLAAPAETTEEKAFRFLSVFKFEERKNWRGACV